MLNKLELFSMEGLKMLEEAFRTYMNALALCAPYLGDSASDSEVIDYLRHKLGGSFMALCKELLGYSEAQVVANTKTWLLLRTGRKTSYRRSRAIEMNAEDNLKSVTMEVVDSLGYVVAKELKAKLPPSILQRGFKRDEVYRMLDAMGGGVITARLLRILSYIYPCWERRLVEVVNQHLRQQG